MVQNTKDLIRAISTSDESILNRLVEKNADLSLSGSTFKGDHVSAMRIHTVGCSDTRWENCIFNDVDFDTLDLQRAKFISCTFHQCQFTKAILAETVFEGCVFNHTSFLDTEDAEALEISHCQFQESIFRGLHFLDTLITASTFTLGELSHLDGEGALRSFVLRDVVIKDFDTSAMQLSACTATGCQELPAGFRSVEGRRRRV